jgi:hypothetical protein
MGDLLWFRLPRNQGKLSCRPDRPWHRQGKQCLLPTRRPLPCASQRQEHHDALVPLSPTMRRNYEAVRTVSGHCTGGHKPDSTRQATRITIRDETTSSGWSPEHIDNDASATEQQSPNQGQLSESFQDRSANDHAGQIATRTPSSTTRSGGIRKNSVAGTALRASTRKIQSRHHGIFGTIAGTSRSRPKK